MNHSFVSYVKLSNFKHYVSAHNTKCFIKHNINFEIVSAKLLGYSLVHKTLKTG